MYRNDKITIDDIERLKPHSIVISPGPGRPDDAGISKEMIARLHSRYPILGVCLGHQCIGEVFGGKIIRARNIMHGKMSYVHHDEKGVFRALENPFSATRYHSLILEDRHIPSCLTVSARTDADEIMGVRHRRYCIEGIQFHPESVLTRSGKQLLQNFLTMADAFRKKQRHD